MGYHENYHHQDPAAVDFRSFYPYTPNEVKHRKRTTSFQLKTLEGIFKTDTKPNAALRQELAQQLEMTPRGVQVWFQNRRAKEKTKALKVKGAVASRSESLEESRDDEVLEEVEADDGDGGQASNQAESSRERDASQPPTRSRSPSNMIPSPPQLHLITDATKFPWQAVPAERTPDSATPPIRPPTNTFLSSSTTPNNDLYAQRRGSLPVPAAQPATSSSEDPLADPFDPMLRRSSVDASLAKLANNPYANLARTKNAALYGPGYMTVGAGSSSRPHPLSQLPYGCPQPRVRHSLASGIIPVPQYGGRRLSMDSRANRSSQLARVHPRMSPIPPTPYNAVIRASLPEHQLYTLSSRTVASPIPGPLPSPDFSFGAASTPSLASPSSGESERNSPDSSRSFFREEEHEDELPSPTYGGGYSRFGSIASVATSDSSINSSYYNNDFGGHVAERVMVNERRDSCASGFLGMLSDLGVNSQAEQMQHNVGVSNCTPQEGYTFGTAEHIEQHGGGDYQYQYSQVQTQQDQFHHTESSYSPASTVSPGKVNSSPNPSENSVITLPTVSLNTPGELTFGLDNKSQQEIAHQEQYLTYHVIDSSNGSEHQQDPSYYTSQHPHSQPQAQDPSFGSTHYGPSGNVYTADGQHHQQLDYYPPEVGYGDHLAGPSNVLDNGMQSTDAFVAYT